MNAGTTATGAWARGGRLVAVRPLVLGFLVAAFASQVAAAPLPIVEGDTWRYFRGQSEPPGTWNTIGFVDTGWELGPGGIGYGDGDDNTVLDGTNPPAMVSNYWSVYIRKTFDVADPGIISALTLTVDYDDAYVCYLNGDEVARSANIVGTPPAFNTAASPGHEASAGASGQPPEITNPSPGLLEVGVNVIACQGHNETLASSDFSLIVELSATIVAGIPNEPTLVAPPNGGGGVSVNPTLTVNVSDPDLDDLDATFYGRASNGTPGEDFTVVHLGDTQHYSASFPGTFTTLTQWIRDHQAELNIVYAAASGDIVNTATIIQEWERADAAYSILESPIAPNFLEGIPYGVVPGNHDQDPNGSAAGTSNYNQYFGIDRFLGRDYYGGNFNSIDNDNNYTLFSAGGMDFISVNMEYNGSPDPAVLNWADTILQSFSDRRAIITTHYFIEVGEQSAFGTQGQQIYNAVMDRPNVFLMLCGHRHGEGKRVDTAGGNTIYTLLSNYQDYPNGGNGWMRFLQFSPANNQIQVRTISPWLTQGNCTHTWVPAGGSLPPGCYQQDADSEFVIPYEMDGNPFGILGTNSAVTSGNNTSWNWNGLIPGETYEWFVRVTDGTNLRTSPTWSFSVACSSPAECDDADPCTVDACTSGECVHTPDNGQACDDGDACTTGDLCAGGTCQGGTPVSCPGGTTCDPGSGACLADPITISFQQNVGGYLTTVDTFINSGATGTNNGGVSPLVIDGDPSIQQALLRFDGIFGGGAIPLGATIVSADLILNVTNDSVNGASFHRMLTTWSSSSTWASAFGANGVQADGVDAVATADASTTSGITLHTVDVTASVAAWSAGATNFGWALLPNGTDSWQFHSAEGATPPRLEVEYLVCLSNADCDDGDDCNGAETCNVGTGSCQPGTPVNCGAQHCNPANGSCVDCLTHVHCDDANFCNGVETCNSGTFTCVAGTVPDCDDSLPCTTDSCNASLGCQNASTCPVGQRCTATGCEDLPDIDAGDVIIAGFNANGAPEFIELFNTTNVAIPLDELEIIVRVDTNADGTLDQDWLLPEDTTGEVIEPHSFFLIAETGVTPGPPDVMTDMKLTTGEAGTAGRSVGIEMTIAGVHMDHVIYGRHDGSDPAGQIPSGDIAFGGFPGERPEVVRTVTGTLPIASFNEGVTQRLSAEDLYAGYDVEGYYTDEGVLPGTYPNGVWTSLHATSGAYAARNSATPPVNPPFVCTSDPECDDGVACTNDTCNVGLGQCQNVDACPGAQTCNLGTGVCESGPVTLTFQDGFSSYTDTLDTFISSGSSSQALAPIIVADGSPATHMLLRFDGIFGPGAGQIPSGSTITSATLTMWVGTTANDESSDLMSFHRLLHSWVDSGVWGDYAVAPWNAAMGIQADGVNAVATADATATLSALNTSYPVSVTASLQAWALDPASNFGWAVLPPLAGTNGLRLESAESTVSSNTRRPLLSVTFTPPAAPCDDDGDCTDGIACNGAETCNVGPGLCVPGTPVVCNDGFACTADSCVEPTGTCQFVPNHAACDDSDVCTDDTCSLVSGCVNTPNTAPCNDGNACTTTDACSGGTCVGSGALNCNDGVACTADSCDSIAGCENVDACPVGQTCNLGTGLCEGATATLTFQDGFLGYTDTLDTFISSGSASQALAPIIVADGSPATHLLLRFAGIFGAGPGQIPAGATIQSATLTLWVGATTNDQSADPMGLHRLLHTWSDSGVWTDYAIAPWNATAGIQPDGVDAVATADATATLSTLTTAYPINVTTSLAAWSADPATNFGWAVIPVSGTDGLRIESSESTVSSNTRRPLLSVTFTSPAGGCDDDGDCNDGLGCNGVETCNVGLGVCVPGTTVTCNDGIACTADSCVNPAGTCQFVPNNGLCNDSNVCTTDTCSAISGCVFTPNAASCNDGNACTTTDVCSGGTCVGSGSPNCNDSVACTDDSCDSIQGCLHEDNCPVGVCNLTTGVCDTGPVTVSFQQGAGGYASTEDTFLQTAAPTAVNGASEVIEWDLEDGTPVGPNFMLLQFGGIFGVGPGQIPPGAQIVSATLEYTVGGPGDATGEPASVHEVLVAWDESVSYDTFGGDPGPSAGDEYAVASVGTALGTPLGLKSVNVTTTVQGWSGNPSNNRGWLFVPAGPTNNGTEVRSSEYLAAPTERPRLTVEYLQTGPAGRMSCQLSSGSSMPLGTVDLTVFLENLGGLTPVRGYQTQLVITRTSGTGTVAVDCPGGVEINDARPDYIFAGQPNDFPATNCALARAASALMTGAVTVPLAPPAYLSNYTLEVSGDATAGSTFSISFAAVPDSSLADTSGQPIAFDFGPACGLTIGGCSGPGECDDGDSCTTDSCVSGNCSHVPNGACSVSGTVRYYRNSGGVGSEPSTKPVPNEDVNLAEDGQGPDTSDAAGLYSFPNQFGTRTVTALDKFGTPRASDHNNAIGATDAAWIAQFSVSLRDLSENQRVAGDVSGNGTLGALDAAMVSQFSVELINHFVASTTRGSDWAFFRCDNYTDEDNQDCAAPVYVHAPLTTAETDDFYAVLYGDVTGNWQPASPLGLEASESEPVFRLDPVDTQRLKGVIARRTTAAPTSRALLSINGWQGSLRAGERRQIALRIDSADGIVALDLALAYDARRIRVVDVSADGIGADLQVVTNDLGGTFAVAAYGIVPLEGSGTVLLVTVEGLSSTGGAAPFEVRATANEGRIPLQVETAPKPAPPRRGRRLNVSEPTM